MSARLEFVFIPTTFQTEVFYLPEKGGEDPILLGVLSPAQAQRSHEMYDWAYQRIALLGLPPIKEHG